MKITSRDYRLGRFATLLVSLSLGALVLSGCAAQSAEPESAATPAPEQTQQEAAPSPLIEVEGRAVSASDTELILRTIDSEMTFQIREEDVRAIDPEHITSHLGVESIGFRAFYRNIDGVDYVVSIEEIDGSTLGFD